MKKSISGLVFLMLCLLSLSINVHAQNNQDSIRSHVETVDGNEYIGIILQQDSQIIRIKTDNLGEISIPRAEVKRITLLTSVKTKEGTYWLDNPQATRYFWSPNGYSLKAGEGYYQNVWILINQVTYGITNHFSAGVGIVPLFLFAGSSSPAWITAKFSVPVVKDKVNLGAGLLAGTIIGQQNTNFGILYGLSTFGSKDKNINIGLGWGFANGEIAKNPTLSISGMLRTGPRGYILTENYFIGTPDNFLVLLSLGGRRIIKHTGLDFGAVIPLGADIGSFVAIPWLGLTIPFGQKSSSVKL
ncbi:MAG TPA: hypothetical protein DCL77_03030 [Prolixibacteraceae bacterium]|jgi:hypothetical protein|nr:hypothetical protein [Prolixibacteraceae bacterium]